MALSPDFTPLIQAIDFKSIQIECRLTNTTTQQPFRAGSPVRLIQFLGDRGLMFEAPTHCCATGHALMIQLNVSTPEAKNVEFEATGKVEQCTSPSKGIDQIQLTLLQFDEKQWNKLLHVFAARQSEIEKFLNSAKGY